MFRFCTFLLQRRSASSTVDAAIKASRSRDFFKRRWLEKRFSKRLTQTIPYSVAREGVVIELDSRETSLVSCLNIIAPAVPLSVSQLGEGDVVITESNKRIVIERKTIEDFYNSINSKRLFDQIGRIYESSSRIAGPTMVVIVLEGSLFADSPLTSPSIYKGVTAMYNALMLRDKIPIIRTESIAETARFVLSLGTSGLSKFFASPNEFSNLVHVERSGRKLSGLNVPYMRLLMSIHGISANRAQAIANAYPTMESLVSVLKGAGGTGRLAQLLAPSSNRSVGSPIGIATAVNIAEAVLGPHHPEVGTFKLFKYLIANTKLANGEALKIAKQFSSLPLLRIAYLSEPNCGLPEPVNAHLASVVDDPAYFLVGLKGVRSISSKTAEAISAHFGSIRGIHSFASSPRNDREALVNSVRLIGTSNPHKRMISRIAVENMLQWLETEGFIPSRKTD